MRKQALAVMLAAAVSLVPRPAGAAAATMGPIGPYLITGAQAEAALARSAAPASIAGHASILTLGEHGYVTAVKGTNGFVCLVVRSWDNTLDSAAAVFWNPKFRAPFCLNAAGARYELAIYLLRTRWAIAGASQQEIDAREKAAWAAGKLAPPGPGAMCYMMSRRGSLNDGRPWHPHVMFYQAHAPASSWGANEEGAPVMASAGDHATIFYVVVPSWSDGTPAPSHP